MTIYILQENKGQRLKKKSSLLVSFILFLVSMPKKSKYFLHYMSAFTYKKKLHFKIVNFLCGLEIMD